jgi:hypothetical protein
MLYLLQTCFTKEVARITEAVLRELALPALVVQSVCEAHLLRVLTLLALLAQSTNTDAVGGEGLLAFHACSARCSQLRASGAQSSGADGGGAA